MKHIKKMVAIGTLALIMISVSYSKVNAQNGSGLANPDCGCNCSDYCAYNPNYMCKLTNTSTGGTTNCAYSHSF